MLLGILFGSLVRRWFGMYCMIDNSLGNQFGMLLRILFGRKPGIRFDMQVHMWLGNLLGRLIGMIFHIQSGN